MTQQDIFSVFVISVLTNLALNGWRASRQTSGSVDAKIDYLYRKTGVTFDALESATPDIVDAMRRGQKIVAIKLYRQATGCGLKDAKDAVENLMRSQAPLQSRGPNG